MSAHREPSRSGKPRAARAGSAFRIRPHPLASGAFLALAPAALAVDAWLGDPASAWSPVAASFVGALFLAAGLLLTRRPRPGRWLGSLGIVGLVALAFPTLRTSPLAALLALLASTAGIALLWNVGALFSSRLGRSTLPDGQARGAACVVLGLWIVAGFSAPVWGEATVGARLPSKELMPFGFPASIGVAASLAVLLALALRWAFVARSSHPRRSLLCALATVGAGTLAVVLWEQGLTALLGPAALALLLSFLLPRGATGQRRTDWEFLTGHPERLLVATFVSLCALGALLLALPGAASSGRTHGFLDAAFTSVSAVCVTGLIVLDTPVDFTATGHAFILLLIQAGGLGIMTFSTAAYGLFGGRMSLRHEVAVAELLSADDRRSLASVARRIIAVTVSAEAAGVLLLLPAFLRHGDAWDMALWRALFTSVSAFCNAGFALQSASLVPYQSDPWILHTVGLLIIAGGLSPAAVLAIPYFLRRPRRPVALEIKLGLAGAGVLLLCGFLCVLAWEWDGALAGLPFGDRLHNAWFQSVTLRTAGFNSIDFTALHPATTVAMMVFMFIGGNPGGTAGGVKTTTVALLLLSIVQAARGIWRIDVFGRRVSDRSVQKAAAIATLAILSLTAGLLALLLTQAIEPLSALFEVVSALGTVGLSTGATTQLDGVGKIIIMGCMFAGRVGPLTVLMFLSHRRGVSPLGRPEEEVAVS